MPVIILSALDPDRGADIGAVEFLKKPLDFDRLLELVRQHCHWRQRIRHRVTKTQRKPTS